MSFIKFLGASGTVTGSSYLLQNHTTQILIDLGMFQGPEEISNLNYQPLLFKPSQLDGVILTHAHIDHCGRLPMLANQGFSGPIYMTEATKVLTDLTLHDSAKIAQEDFEHHPLYSPEDVDKILSMAQVVPYEKVFNIGAFEFKLIDAGHILGSASVIIKDKTAEKGLQTIVFSGDIGSKDEDLLRPTELIGKADIVVMESTYGDKDHPEEDSWDIIQQEINAIEKDQSTLLIPSFSIEKTQEILHIIDHLKKDNKVLEKTQVYLDSPMAIKATNTYKQFPQLYSAELREHRKHDDPFDFPGLAMVQSANRSKLIRNVTDPKVIIAGSGMMSGGRILHHAKQYLSDSKTHLLFVGYQAQGTIGRQILEGADRVNIYGSDIKINANIRRTQAMSSHAGQTKLLKWLKNMKGVDKVYVTHGEDEPRQILAYKIRNELEIHDVTLPQLGDQTEVN